MFCRKCSTTIPEGSGGALAAEATAGATKGQAVRIVAALLAVALIGCGTTACSAEQAEEDAAPAEVETVAEETEAEETEAEEEDSALAEADTQQVEAEAETEAQQEADEAEQAALREEMYSAYAAIVQQYEDSRGVGSYTSHESYENASSGYYPIGVFLLELVDFDGDGQEELLMGFESYSIVATWLGDSSFDPQIIVWSYADGEAVKVYPSGGIGITGDVCHSLEDYSWNIVYDKYSNGKIYIEDGTFGGLCDYYEYEDGTFQTVRSVSRKQNDDVWQYTVNGVTMTEEEYETQEEQWRSNITESVVYKMPNEEENIQEILAITKQTKATLGMSAESGVSDTGTNWAELYADYLKTAEDTLDGFDDTGACYFVYVNNDDVPEIVYEKDSGLEGSFLFYIQDGQVKVHDESIDYEIGAEYEGYLFGGGSLGRINTVLYLGDDCELTTLFSGVCGSWSTYTCNGESVTKEEYYQRFAEACSGCSWITVTDSSYSVVPLGTQIYGTNEYFHGADSMVSYLRGLSG